MEDDRLANACARWRTQHLPPRFASRLLAADYARFPKLRTRAILVTRERLETSITARSCDRHSPRLTLSPRISGPTRVGDKCGPAPRNASTGISALTTRALLSRGELQRLGRLTASAVRLPGKTRAQRKGKRLCFGPRESHAQRDYATNAKRGSSRSKGQGPRTGPGAYVARSS